MFELSLPHILLLLVIAMLVIGPKNLPEIAKTLGKIFGEFQRAADDLKREIQTPSPDKPENKPENKPDDPKTGETSASPETEQAATDKTPPPEKPS
jgi:TatA/E family protein of Tat protein translocase